MIYFVALSLTAKTTEMITWNDFEKIDIRSGTITEVTDFPKAKKPSYQLTIDFGEEGIKRSSAQITHHYSKDALIGKQVVAIINFPIKQIANFFSVISGVEKVREWVDM